MNPALAWSKKNWPIIVCGLVIVGSVPTAWYFSSGWNKKIKEQQQTAGTRALNDTNIKANYVVPSLIPGEPELSLTDAPNEHITREFIKIKEELARQAKAVMDRVTAFNKGTGVDARAVGRAEHAVMVPSLFPGPTQAQINQAAFPGKDQAAIDQEPAERRSELFNRALRDLIEPGLREMEDRLLGKRGHADPYEGLVRAANGGTPPSAPEVLLTVNDVVRREGEKMAPSDDQAQKLTEIARSARIGRYQGATQGFSVYMTRGALGAPGATQGPSGSSAAASSASVGGMRQVPGEATFRTNTALLNERELFLFQWDYWIMSDVVAAVRLANTADGKPTTVANSVVKRIDRLAATTFPAIESVSTEQANPLGATTTPATPATPGAEVKPDYSISITGRTTSPANPDYDVRGAVIVAVVSSEKLPLFLDALTRVNFNSVLQVQLSEVDVKSDLERGYFYGPEHVVRATVTLETVWLRNWTGPLMPASVKRVLGVPEPTPEAPADPNAQPK